MQMGRSLFRFVAFRSTKERSFAERKATFDNHYLSAPTRTYA